MNAASFYKIRNTNTHPRLADPVATLRHLPIWQQVPFRPGERIAIAVGSRGIAHIDALVRATVDQVRRLGAQPFIIPAMGSHGGATADGQRDVLASYQITEATMGCPILSSLEVVPIPQLKSPVPVHIDKYAWNADGIVLINRIKPHTDFHGPYESGLAKMAVIGLGKETQARLLHSFGTHGLRTLMPEAALSIVATGKIRLAIGILENALDQTAEIHGLAGDQILPQEPGLLDRARAYQAKLALDDLDILIVDRLGKDISGAGMDTNFIGRIRIPGEPEPASPRIKMIVACDLTDATHGNAVGTGLADVITQRLFSKMDLPVTRLNVVTSGFLERGKIPIIADTDLQALQIALRGCGEATTPRPRILRIRDTLHPDEFYASEAACEALKHRSEFVTTAGPISLFLEDGSLRPFDCTT